MTGLSRALHIVSAEVYGLIGECAEITDASFRFRSPSGDTSIYNGKIQRLDLYRPEYIELVHLGKSGQSTFDRKPIA